MPLRRLLPIALIVALLLSYVPLSVAAMPCCASAGMQMAGMAAEAMTAEAPAPEAAPATALMPHCHMSASKAASKPVAADEALKPSAHIRNATMTVCQQAACVVPTRAVTAALFSAEPLHTALLIVDDVTAPLPLPSSAAHAAAPSPPPLTQRLTAPLPLRI